jgi:hypothetical protein
MAELTAGLTDGRCVDHRRQFLQMVEQEPIEQRFVAILERRQSDIALEVVRLVAQMFKLQKHLLLDRGHAVWQ